MKYYVMYNVGKVKYLLNYWNGYDTCVDGSEHYDICCFNNKLKLAKNIKELEKLGYKRKGDII